jgi:ethanolaminephosphotransferase
MVYHLNNNDKITLKNYSYNGYDSSLTYKYILSPFAQFCVDQFIPIWMAPNVVTLLGLIGINININITNTNTNTINIYY